MSTHLPHPSQGRVAGKIAIVSGAASGIGAEQARLLVHEGAFVIVGDIDSMRGQALAAELGKLLLLLARCDEPGRLVGGNRCCQPAVGYRRCTGEQRGHRCLGRVRRGNSGQLPQGARSQSDRRVQWHESCQPWHEAPGSRLDHQHVLAGWTEGLVARPWVHCKQIRHSRADQVSRSRSGPLQRPRQLRSSRHHRYADDRRANLSDRSSATQTRSPPAEIARLTLFLASDEASFSTGAEFIADGGETAGFPGPAFVGQAPFKKIDYANEDAAS